MAQSLLIPVLVPIVLFSSLFGIVYIIYITRHRERMALIENGMSADIFNDGHRHALKFALLLIGIGLGLLAGYGVYTVFGLNQIIVQASMALTFGGLGLLTYYQLMRRKDKREEERY